jgi:NitT/TauT family transport system permease protein
MIAGVAAMIVVIVVTDFIIWRPILAWSQKFRLEEAQDQTKDIPFVTLILKDSKLLKWITARFLSSGRIIRDTVEEIERAPLGPQLTSRVQPVVQQVNSRLKRWRSRWRRLKGEIPFVSNIGTNGIYALAILVLIVGGLHVYELVRPLQWEAWRAILWGGALTLGRVTIALLLSSLWTIPAGIWIGSNQKLVRLLQPFVQILAAFPAPMLYPLALMLLASLGMMNQFPAILLMMLGVQWYILFNVLAGASTISKELKISLELIGVSKWTMWKKLYLPSVFPALISGWITAAGGAWNASIIAEYVEFGKQTVMVDGLGSLIKQSTDAADYHMLAACLFVMCVGVVTLNRVVWGYCYRLSERRFRFEG